MQKVKFVYRLAVIAIFLAGFLVGGCYIRFLDTVDGYNANMVQDAITRLEQVQFKYQQKLGESVSTSNIMIQPVSSDIMIQPIVESTDIMIQP
ncbi:MAG: hypothetical protein WCT46_05485 [Candidatus Gracilibacteria bacterium]|jgi:hypothetical protein